MKSESRLDERHFPKTVKDSAVLVKDKIAPINLVAKSMNSRH